MSYLARAYKEARLVNLQDAGGYLSAATVEAAFQEIGPQMTSAVLNVAKQPGFSFASARAAFQSAIATLTIVGGGTIAGPVGDYTFDTSNEATCLVCTVPIQFEFQVGTRFFFGFYDLSMINFVGCTGGGVRNVEFVFTGTRPGTAAGLTANHFGFNSTGVDSPPNFAAFVSLLGCNYVTLENVKWRGNTTGNIKEMGIQVTGGTSAGPNLGSGGTSFIPGAGAVLSKGIKIVNCESNDVYFGFAGLMFDDLTLDRLTSRRYKQEAFVGPGHAVYVTGHAQNSRFMNLMDTGEFIDTPGSSAQVGALSYQFRSINRCIVSNLRSARVEGVMSFLNNSNDNIVDGVHWSGDRVPYEVGLTNTPVLIVAQTDATSTQNRNHWSNFYLNDVLNAGAARSANCPIVGNSSATVVSANMVENVWSNINIVYAPDAAFGRGVCLYQGQRSTIEYKLCNLGTGTTKNTMQLTGVAAGSLAGNTVHWHLTGPGITTFNLLLTNSAGSNTVFVHGAGNVSQQNSSTGAIAGDKVITDDAMYSTRADQLNNVTSHKVVHALTAGVTVPTPAPGLTFVGSVLDFSFVAAGVHTVTYPASFKAQANGAAAAGKVGSTRFVCTDATSPVWSQQGGALAFN